MSFRKDGLSFRKDTVKYLGVFNLPSIDSDGKKQGGCWEEEEGRRT